MNGHLLLADDRDDILANAMAGLLRLSKEESERMGILRSGVRAEYRYTPRVCGAEVLAD